MLLFSSGANEELRCWKVDVGLACNQPEVNFCELKVTLIYGNFL